MQLDPEEYIDIPEVNCFALKEEPKPKFKKATYKNFPLNDVPPTKDHEKYLYIEYRTY